MRIAVPDLISNSYFPAVAAVDLGCFASEGLDVSLDLIFPVDRCYEMLRDGEIDIVAGSAHSALAAFPGFRGAKLVCAQAQGMYWFLVMRRDLGIARGDLQALKGLRIGAAPWVEMGLRRLLVAGGLDLQRDRIAIGPVPGAAPVPGQVVNFGLSAAKALEEGKIDGFWANGMGTAVAVSEGVGSIVVDVRRGEGPTKAFDYTMASIAMRSSDIADDPDKAAAVVRGVGRAHAMLRADPGLATKVASKRFPERETRLIRELIERDLPYYNLAITRESVSGMSQFALDLGLIDSALDYAEVAALEMSEFWTEQEAG